jgi:dTDP-4-amino-4,6-dideoxygalactose transaminase
MAGHNYRLTDLQAALAIPQLAHLEETTTKRRGNAQHLINGLADVRGLRLPQQLPGRGHVWHQFTVLITDESPVKRDEFVGLLTERGVGSGIYYPKLVFDYECYRDNPRVKVTEVPVATSVTDRVVSLPVHPGLSTDELDTVVATVRDLMKA